MTTDEIKELAAQCICHPASRSITDVENAGMAIIELLERVEADRLAWISHGMRGLFDDQAPQVTEDQQKALQELADDSQLVYSAWSR